MNFHFIWKQQTEHLYYAPAIMMKEICGWLDLGML
jgi:hypothetical protein